MKVKVHDGWTKDNGDVVPPYIEDIRLSDTRHKFGDAMAEYLWIKGPDYEDESTGDVEWDIYVQRFGKRLLCTDDRGFVECVKFQNEEAAKGAFRGVDAAYGAWLDEEGEF